LAHRAPVGQNRLAALPVRLKTCDAPGTEHGPLFAEALAMIDTAEAAIRRA
jgi:hypothetical protein